MMVKSKVNNLSEIDNRSFREIWKSLGFRSAEQMELRDALISRMRVTRQTVNNWGLGKCSPSYMEVKRGVSREVNRHLGIHTNPITLFPYER